MYMHYYINNTLEIVLSVQNTFILIIHSYPAFPELGSMLKINKSECRKTNIGNQ